VIPLFFNNYENTSRGCCPKNTHHRISFFITQIRILEKRLETASEIILDMDFTLIYYGLGDYDKLFAYLERAYELRLGGILILQASIFHHLKNEEQFKDLVKRTGMPFHPNN
jgi:hypothetical protein